MSFYQDGDYWELPSEEEEGGDEKDEERGGRGGAYFEENIDFHDLVRKKTKYFCAKLSFHPDIYFSGCREEQRRRRRRPQCSPVV